jgi:hypothetical protein
MVKVVVWGVPGLVHDGIAHTRTSMAAAPVVNCLKSMGLSDGGYCIFFPEDAEASVGNVIMVEVEHLPSTCLKRHREAGLLATELQMIWPGRNVEVNFNDVPMATRR